MKRALSAAALALPAALAVSVAVPTRVSAQPVSGLYVGAGAGGNFMPPSKVESIYQYSTTPRLNAVYRDKERYDTGLTGVASVGWGFGNGFRVEAEGDYRRNGHSDFAGHQQKYGAMANALFDFDIGSRYVFPYAGAGAGFSRVDDGRDGYRSNTFAYQGILGAAFPIPYLVGLSATLEYRFLGLGDASEKANYPGLRFTQKEYNNLNHSVMLGVRYAFNVPRPAAPEAPAPAAVPATQPARSYLIFFDWDRADLTARARQILAEAAQNIARIQHTRIEVDGHADRSGSPQYNTALSRRRAETVAAELVRLGVARSEIGIQAFGDTHPLVPTAVGVREPQNRRVEIIVR